MTRPFTNFNVATPTITQSRMAAINSTRDNQIAMYLNAAIYGGIGWHGSVITRDDSGRAKTAIARNAYDPVAVRADWTYYESGPAEGRRKTSAVYYSDDYTGDGAAATWAAVGTINYTYDADGNTAAATWVKP